MFRTTGILATAAVSAVVLLSACSAQVTPAEPAPATTPTVVAETPVVSDSPADETPIVSDSPADETPEASNSPADEVVSDSPADEVVSDSPADRLDDLTDVPFDPADAAPQPHANGFGAKACFDASGKALEPDGTKSDITNGASRIWLCGDAGQQFDAVGPNEPLITNLDTLTQYLIEQPEVSGDIYEPGTLFTLVIEYPDGTKHVASALNQPGGGIYFGDGVAYGSGDQLFDLAHSLWQIQRKAIEERDAAPADPAALASCPTHQYALFEVGTADVVAGFLCTEADLHKGERVSLTPAAAKVIAGELESNSVAGYGEWPTDTFMVLTNAWGDTMRLRQERDNTWVWVGNGHGTPMVWTPSAEAQAAIDAAN